MYSLQASSRAVSRRAAAPVPACRSSAVHKRRVILRRAEGSTPATPPASSPAAPASDGPDYGAQANEAVNKAVDYAKNVWDTTADAEKPAIIAIILAVSVAQIGIGATMDKIDKIPVVGDFLELVGVAVAATYGYKYATDPAERSNVSKTIDDLMKKVTGK